MLTRWTESKEDVCMCAWKYIYIYVNTMDRIKGRCLYVHIKKNIYIYVNTMDRNKGRCLYVHMEIKYIYIYIC